MMGNMKAPDKKAATAFPCRDLLTLGIHQAL
jgi:hypothetical protein